MNGQKASSLWSVLITGIRVLTRKGKDLGKYMFFDHEIQDYVYCVPIGVGSNFFLKKRAVSNIDKSLFLRHHRAMKNAFQKTEGYGVSRRGEYPSRENIKTPRS